MEYARRDWVVGIGAPRQALWFVMLIAALIMVPSCRSDEPLPPSAAPDSGFLFPQMKTTAGESVLAGSAIGKLVAVNGCIRLVGDDDAGMGSLLVWPSDFGLSVQGSVVGITSGNGEVVARLGDYVRITGGEIPASQASWITGQLRQPLPTTCMGPYILVGSIEAIEESG